MELNGKVAVVTGGGVRIGRAITLALARAGCHVFIHYGRSVGPAQQTEVDAKALGVNAHIHAADLSDEKATQSIISAAQKQFRKLDILINNAAIFSETDTFTKTDMALWERMFAVNLRAPFFLDFTFYCSKTKNIGKMLQQFLVFHK